jgi:hypothetical protein
LSHNEDSHRKGLTKPVSPGRPWIKQGQSVEITKAGKAFARLVPAPPQKRRRFKMPDIMARLDQTFGQVCYDAGDTATGLAAGRGELS